MGNRLAALALLLCAVFATSGGIAQTLDLTGMWRDNNDVSYAIRQLDGKVYWSSDALPTRVNVFVGSVNGDTLAGEWVDLPGGTLLNNGALTLHIDSNDRLSKISSSPVVYGADIWTRVGAADGPVASPEIPPVAGKTAQELWGMNAVEHRADIGRRFTYTCPPIAAPVGGIFGTGFYTDDSKICTAAVHAGLITTAGGGVVTIEMQPGAETYDASTLHGITSDGYGKWDGSYAFVGADGSIIVLPKPFPPVYAASNANAMPHRGETGKHVTYGCTPGFSLGSIWGTGIYTDDSPICTAAVHAGLIGIAAGGWVTIEIVGDRPSFAGSASNGVTSGDYGHWPGSYSFVGVSARPPGGGRSAAASGPCDDPRTLAIMDQWLSQAVPTAAGDLRYEPWGRAVGRSQTAQVTALPKPDTTLSRCAYLAQHAGDLPSRNLGTLLDYLKSNGVM